MNITLSPKIQQLIQKMVDRGNYAGPDEVMEEALHLLEDRDSQTDRFRESLVEAHAQIARGEGVTWSPELRNQIRKRAIALVQSGIPLDPDVCP
jgi:putative addiction module CopG family antidote